MRAAMVALALLLTVACEPVEPSKTPKEDTSDERVIQFHEVGQLRYGRWYAAQGNRACQWRVEAGRAGDDAKRRVLESGGWDDAVRVQAEMPGWDVFLRFNKACGWFEEAK